MKENKKIYWKGLEQLSKDPEFVKYANKEFAEYLPLPNEMPEEGSSRRDFLKMMGFGIAAASLAACEAPIRKAIPYVNKPVDVDPGIPNYYASTYVQGGDYCSILVKTREGRPIKVEGNTLSKVSGGGVNAQVEASILSLYDNERLRGPLAAGESTSWENLDYEITSKLRTISVNGGGIRILSNTILSPGTEAAIEDFKAKYPTAEHLTYDPYSSAGMLKANETNFGKRALPSFDFSKAKSIVSFGADFLGTWINPIAFTKQYSKNRKLGDDKKTMSRHFQFEANLSLTGANADYRTPLKPSQEGVAVVALYNLIAGKSGASKISGGSIELAHLSEAADSLWSNRGASLVVSGSNDPAVQEVINGINQLLGNYGRTIDLAKHTNFRKGDDSSIDQLIADLALGRVAGVIFYNTNPVYNHPSGAKLAEALGKASLSISTSDRNDETASLCGYVAPDHHYLESWNDYEPVKGSYSLSQPAIRPIFDTRQTQESLLNWSGNNVEYFDYLKDRWENNMYPGGLDFQKFWDTCLHDGIWNAPDQDSGEAPAFGGNLGNAAAAIAKNYKAESEGIDLVLYQKAGIGDGSQANNPWLQEMPDPITKATWDNYLTVSQSFANDQGFTSFEGKTNKAKVTVGDHSFEIPLVIQPGQAPGTVGIALGYGRTKAGKVANALGVDVYPLVKKVNDTAAYFVSGDVKIEILSEKYQVAQTQTHQTYMGRTFVVQESILPEYQKNPSAGRVKPKIATWQDESHKVAPGSLSLWKGHRYENHHWGMVVDLNSCTGCSACHIACQAENNIPVVGRAEVINRRDMHWIRIDRYYSSVGDPKDKSISGLKKLEQAADNPEVTFQPMMCQHCNNAPCETVCPVAATTHSTEGLNQMAYNRCIGTRYCANNCPYKVRRFNWFKYHDNDQFGENSSMNSDLGKMVLNPDVTVRSRGVMEKCSFCVQRLQQGKLVAKKENRRPTDEDVQVACAKACPADALVFGDMNDPESKISKMLKIQDLDDPKDASKVDKRILEPRAYHVLEEVGVKPNVVYLTKIRNKETNA